MKYMWLLAIAVVLTGSVRAQQSGVPPPAPSQEPPSPFRQEQEDYTISRQDVLSITVIDQPELTAKYTVDADGSIRFPLIGRVNVAGKTLRQAEAELKRLLGDGFFKNPQVAVSIDQFKGRRIFVFGAVGSGTLPLAEGETLLEAMVKVGYASASEVVVLRSKGAKLPLLPDTGSADEVIRVNLRELEKEVEQGNLSRNIPLQDGDTIFVPRFDKNRIFVTGQVKAPASYSVPEGTTVLQAITLAGGVTEAASLGRVRIIRIVGDEKKTIKVKLEDTVQPGDTIVVPERFF